MMDSKLHNRREFLAVGVSLASASLLSSGCDQKANVRDHLRTALKNGNLTYHPMFADPKALNEFFADAATRRGEPYVVSATGSVKCGADGSFFLCVKRDSYPRPFVALKLQAPEPLGALLAEAVATKQLVRITNWTLGRVDSRTGEIGLTPASYSSRLVLAGKR